MDLPTMQQRKRLRVSEVNPHLICVLCGGYYIDATTITECLHTFCKTCIVGYLEASKHCPVCDNLVHKTKPHLRLRPDHTLQDLVYKLVPGLFKDEMNKRREFYRDEIQSGKLGENGIPEERERIIYSQDEQISLVLEMSSNGRPPLSPSAKSNKHQRMEAVDRRYLQCPANITVGHLKKFLKMKFNLCDRFQIDFFHTDEILRDHYTLVDIAYIYSWRRKGPLSLYYTVFTNPAKRFKMDHGDEDLSVEAEITTKEVDISKVSERTETSGYLTDDDKEGDNNMSDRSLESNILPESGSNDSFELDSSDFESVKVATDAVTHKPDVDDCAIAKVSKMETESCNVDDSKCTESDVSEDVNEKNKSEISTDKESGMNEETLDYSLKDMCKTDSVSTCDMNIQEMDTKNKTENRAEEKNVKDPVDKVSDELDVTESKSHESKCEINETKTEKPQTSEASTSTICVNDKDTPVVNIRKEERSKVKDDDVSEPVVSSTQNTQACQTEPPESHSEKFDLPHSSDYEKPLSEKTSHAAKVDVSCETENFAILRQISVESVSVSTETEKEASSSEQRKNSVDCATDVFDFPKSVSDNKRSVDCSTDSQDLPELIIENTRKTLSVDCSTEMDDAHINNKRKTLSVDCSTEIDDRDSLPLKRKSSDSFDQRQGNKKGEFKGTKRSNSHNAYSPKTSYMAQPLSPTKITLKFSATKASSESVKPVHPQKTQPQVTGFQSKYQSFVMELPEKTYDFDSEPEKRVQTTLPAKTTENYKQTYMNTISTSTKKSQSKTGRPRGRPPKIKPPEQIETHKEKKHKSRSHSPKHRKHSDKHDKYSSSSNNQSTTSKQSSSSSNAYTWINKVNSNTKQHAEKKQPKSKPVESSNEKPPGELKIPKQFLFFSNGQYTLATESSLASLKQSSPRSPTRTVWETQTSSYGDKHSKSDKSKDKDKKLDKVEKVNSEKQMHKKESASISKTDEPVDTIKSVNPGSDKQEESAEAKPNSKGNAEVKTTNFVSSSAPEAVVSTVTANTVDSSKEAVGSSSEKFPEYRHQSPFFASYTRLGVHRPSAHLNIPNFTSHFSSAHPLYNHGRYTSDRLGIPIYRSMTLSEPKGLNVPVSSTKQQDKHRMESINSPCGFLSPFPSPFLGLSHLHSHIASSLPPSLSQKGYSPDSTKSLTSGPAGTPVCSSINMSQNKSAMKPGTMRKGKEKSIDNIISAITEMRTKKETTAQEQLNGIDLSTKSSRQNATSLTTNNNDKLDKYAFPDDEEDNNRTSPKRGLCKALLE